MTIDFPLIVSKTISNPPSDYETGICPDQYVGEIGSLLNDTMLPSERSSIADRPDKPAVLLVLESPHTEEFKDSIGPAKGATGRNIARYLGIDPELQSMLDAPLILMNAVQYQCSLGVNTSINRDEVFKAVWKHGEANFKQRLQEIYRVGDIIVCACTKGNRRTGPSELRQLVHKAIVDCFPEATILRRTHPAKWNMPSMRERGWEVLV